MKEEINIYDAHAIHVKKEKMEADYQKLLAFVKHILKQSCSMMDGINCPSCLARGLLKEIGEL